MDIPKYKDVVLAHERIRPYIHRTPVLTSKSINEIIGCELFFKCENFQKVGAFKFRGASNAVFYPRLNDLKMGVVTHSSGNHAAALAHAASLRGIPSYIVMPDNAPKMKIKAVQGYGGQITFCKPTNVAREQELEKVIEKTGAMMVHPYNNFMVISGQGTCVKELMEEIAVLDAIITPVGGGGLLSGTCIAAHALDPNIKIYAGEPKGADDAFRSIATGEIQPSLNPHTIADGLLTSLGSLTFEIIRNHISQILAVDDDAIITAMRLVWERMKIIIEPSAAVPLAAIMKNCEIFKNKRVGVVFSGGNIAPETAAKLF